jgi:nucleotide-binding universal stress UspA family protein
MDHKDFFSRWLPAQERSWLVTGSYGRSDLSLLFSKSFISSLIGEHRIPVFMAHR